MLTNGTISALVESEKGGAMGLFKRKNSECWHMCFFLEGRKVRKSTGTSNKRGALKIYDSARLRVAQGTYDEKTCHDMTFSELADQFLQKHCLVEKSSYKRDQVSAKVLKSYFGNKTIGTINLLDIKKWRKWRMERITRTGTPITRAAVNRELAFMKTMFNFAIECGWIKANPTQNVKLLKGETKRFRILSREEVAKLIAAANVFLRPILIAAVSTGMRKGELLSLRWKNVDFSHGFIRVEHSKNMESRTVPMSDHLGQVLLHLKKGRSPSDFVFCREEGRRILCLKEAFKRACKKAGITDFRFHDLRHTAASLLAAGGCDLITLQNILGHKSLSMTQRYAHIIPERFEKSRQIMQDYWQGSALQVGDTKVTQLVARGIQRTASH